MKFRNDRSSRQARQDWLFPVTKDEVPHQTPVKDI